MVNPQMKTWKSVLYLNSLIFVLETNGFEMCRGNGKHDFKTMVTYSHASTPLGQSERAYYLSYFIRANEWVRCCGKSASYITTKDIKHNSNILQI